MSKLSTGLLIGLAVTFSAAFTGAQVASIQSQNVIEVQSTPGNGPEEKSHILVVGWEGCKPCQDLHAKVRGMAKADRALFNWNEHPNGMQHKVGSYPLIAYVVGGKIFRYESSQTPPEQMVARLRGYLKKHGVRRVKPGPARPGTHKGIKVSMPAQDE